MAVSTPEATAFDLVRFPAACAGWNNIATVLFEMAERLEPDALGAVSRLRKTPDVQRLGYLLERVGQPRLSDALLRVLASRRYRPVALASDAKEVRTDAVSPWRVIPNVEVEIDP
jgi:predicted transcriptional regulator of viral defense system